jgi:hypothetical protein
MAAGVTGTARSTGRGTWSIARLSPTRDMDAAQRCFAQALDVAGAVPAQVTTDGHDPYPRTVRETLGDAVTHRTSRYENNRLEQDTGAANNATTRCVGSTASCPPPASASASRGSASIAGPRARAASGSRSRSVGAATTRAGRPLWPRWPPPAHRRDWFPVASGIPQRLAASRF